MTPPRLTLVQRIAHIERADAEPPYTVERQAAPRQTPEPEQTVSASVTTFPSGDRREKLRILEALLFAAAEPLDETRLAVHIKDPAEVGPLLEELRGYYAARGFNLVRVAGKWAFRTAQDLGYLLEKHALEERRLSRAALETLAIIAYHQPVTRAEIEEVRGVTTSKGTLDVLMETGWIRPRGRRRAPGKPVTYGTTDQFLGHFGLDGVKDLPGLAELKGAGLLDSNLPPGFSVPEPMDVAALMPDELPLDSDDEETAEFSFDEPAEGDDREPNAGLLPGYETAKPGTS